MLASLGVAAAWAAGCGSPTTSCSGDTEPPAVSFVGPGGVRIKYGAPCSGTVYYPVGRGWAFCDAGTWNYAICVDPADAGFTTDDGAGLDGAGGDGGGGADGGAGGAGRDGDGGGATDGGSDVTTEASSDVVNDFCAFGLEGGAGRRELALTVCGRHLPDNRDGLTDELGYWIAAVAPSRMHTRWASDRGQV
jgi:hypothetical protein